MTSHHRRGIGFDERCRQETASARATESARPRGLIPFCPPHENAFGAAFYNTSGAAMAGAWVIELFANTAASTMLNAYSVELFPTSHRATASSSLTVVNTLGGILGLLAEPLIYSVVGTTWRAVSLIYMVALGAVPVVLVLFPETAGKELDELSPERYEGRARRRINWRRSKAAS